MIVLSVILYLAGIAAFFYGLRTDTYGATQQTVQYLAYVIGAIFISSGSIVLAITKKAELIKDSVEKVFKYLEKAYGDYTASKATSSKFINEEDKKIEEEKK